MDYHHGPLSLPPSPPKMPGVDIQSEAGNKHCFLFYLIFYFSVDINELWLRLIRIRQRGYLISVILTELLRNSVEEGFSLP